MDDMIKVLNLGAGVQSTTILRMSIKGEIEKPDHVIFADTGWEPKAVYAHLKVLEQEMKDNDINFYKVSCNRNIKEDALMATVRGLKKNGQRYANLPFYTRDRKTGQLGIIRRQCTREYKIDPIAKKTRELVKIPRKSKNNNQPIVERWIGISLDEIQRMKYSKDWWAINYYPLIDLRMTRDDCLRWMERNGYPEPPRSACIACPFHSMYEWRQMKMNSPEEFEEACQFDEAIRERGGMRGDIFVHSSCKPLRECDFSTAEDHGQQNLFRDLECAGICGV
jgi:3'-phosphoadenosine 5'-phosphosulfate sulfotransferase (PAPS reductase)/FAD synthetase